MISNSLNEVLNAREARYHYRLELMKGCGGCLVSITLNIPLPQRNESKYRFLMYEAVAAVYAGVSETRIKSQTYYKNEDGPCVFMLVDGAAEDIKRICIDIEDTHKYGRIFDIDVMGPDKRQLGRRELSLPKRKCFICKESAANCIVSRRHSKDEILNALENMVFG